MVAVAIHWKVGHVQGALLCNAQMAKIPSHALSSMLVWIVHLSYEYWAPFSNMIMDGTVAWKILMHIRKIQVNVFMCYVGLFFEILFGPK